MLLLHVLLFATLAGGSAGKYPNKPQEIAGLSLRGDGCHVDLVGADGSVICKGISTAVPKCFPLSVFRDEADGGMAVDRFKMGSSCPAPRFMS